MPENKYKVSMKEDIAQAGEISTDHQAGEVLRLRLKGSWKIGAKFPSADVVKKQIETAGTENR